MAMLNNQMVDIPSMIFPGAMNGICPMLRCSLAKRPLMTGPEMEARRLAESRTGLPWEIIGKCGFHGWKSWENVSVMDGNNGNMLVFHGISS